MKCCKVVKNGFLSQIGTELLHPMELLCLSSLPRWADAGAHPRGAVMDRITTPSLLSLPLLSLDFIKPQPNNNSRNYESCQLIVHLFDYLSFYIACIDKL